MVHLMYFLRSKHDDPRLPLVVIKVYIQVRTMLVSLSGPVNSEPRGSEQTLVSNVIVNQIC